MSKRPTPRVTASDRPARTGPATAQQRLAADRAAAARARIADTQRRRRMWTVGGSVAAIVAVVAVLIVVKIATGAGSPKSGTKATAAQSAVLARISSIPASVLDTVGSGTVKAVPAAVTAPALTQNGKPLVLYVGAEYCPYCAAERWPVAVALSRFGTMHGVGQTASSPSDVYPSTPTLSFHGATYTSNYLALTAKEIQSNQVNNGTYAPLDTLTADEQTLMTKYDAPPYQTSTGSIPFIDISGQYLVSGASYDPGVLKGKTHAQIAAALSDPTSAIARAVDGTANTITAALCKATAGKPSAVCDSTAVTAGAAKLASTG